MLREGLHPFVVENDALGPEASEEHTLCRGRILLSELKLVSCRYS